ncbi:hypothetical protein FRB95_004400 [Tulasnella sp. JGI-2019a]|nr:hypothetical protein FRB95_004400 [Tulasnella sp. JGI-2019a]
MPELPEVERAKELLRSMCVDRIIEDVETSEDTIVYSGVSHTEFAAEVKGRKVVDVARYGKVFYMVLEGGGRMPVLHLGMTGMVQVKGDQPTWYRVRPKDVQDEWPPRWMKFILHFAATDTQPAVQVAFRDARRLARIRLCAKPLEEPPISELGFDPLLSMPSVEDFSALVKKRNCPVKALLLDQSFSAGVGNWVADEILFQARIHPEQRASTLDDAEILLMHEKTVSICQTAVDVHADSSKFPTDWLFPHRWGKGKKEKTTPLILPDGEAAKIKWLTVGGRTSAFVEQVQKLSKSAAGSAKTKPKNRGRKAAQEDDDGNNSSDLSDAPGLVEHAQATNSSVKRGKRKAVEKEEEEEEEEDIEETMASSSKSPAKRPRKIAKAEANPVVVDNILNVAEGGSSGSRRSRKAKR